MNGLSAERPGSGPLIVDALLGAADLRVLDALRRAHYPAERNRLPAHLTLFHALPPSAEGEVLRLLKRLAAGPPPPAMIDGIIDLGSGVALRIRSPELEAIRAELADRLRGLLSAQDAAGWRPHVTVQNKVERHQASKLLKQLRASCAPHPLAIRGLGLHHYLGGAWGRLAEVTFRGGRPR